MPYKLKPVCTDCRVDTIDNTLGCLDKPCQDTCVECFRYSGGCEGCTCNYFGFQACATVTVIEDCSCLDGGTFPHSVITGVWIGWTGGEELQDIAEQWCPGNPITEWRLYGSIWDFDTHETTSNMDCPVTTGGYGEIDWGPIEDLEGTPLEVCTNGYFLFTAEEWGIESVPTPGGTGSDCTQEGGHEMLLVEVKDGCDNTIVLCPFRGVIGEQFTCEFVNCCFWSFEITNQSTDGTTFTLTIVVNRTPDCEFEPISADLIVDGTTYPLSTFPETIVHDITPYTPGDIVTVTLNQDYAEGTGCTDDSTSQNVTLF